MAEEKICSPESERAVLGCILLDTTSRNGDRVMDLCLTGDVTADAFSDFRNKWVYETMLELNRAAKPLDPLTLIEELQKKKVFDSIGGPAYVQALIDQVPTSAHAEHYIGIVQEKHMRRKLRKIGQQCASDATNERDYPAPEIVLGNIEKELLNMHADTRGEMTWRQASTDAYFQLDRLFDARGKIIDGIATGFKSLDGIVGGFKRGEMVVIGARPSVGKTSLMMDIACATEKEGNGVTIFSLEMGAVSLAMRIAAKLAGIDITRLRAGDYDVDPDEKDRLREVLAAKFGELAKMKFHVVENSDLNIERIRSIARHDVRHGKTGLIVIDYIQLCHAADSNRIRGRTEEVTAISQAIKAMAKELKVPVVALSQLNRQSANAQYDERDGFEEPKLADCRDSGAIEQDADVAILLNRIKEDDTKALKPEERQYSQKVGQSDCWMNVNVAKNRNGATGRVHLFFDRAHTTFTEPKLRTV